MSMPHKTVAKLASVQAAPVWLNRDATIAKACRFIHQAGEVPGWPTPSVSIPHAS